MRHVAAWQDGHRHRRKPRARQGERARAGEGNTAYCLAESGMRMLIRSAGVDLAPHGIVVGVGPGRGAAPPFALWPDAKYSAPGRMLTGDDGLAANGRTGI